jgi:hypothetical protein
MNVKSHTLMAAALLTASLLPMPALGADQTSIGKPLSKQAVLSELTTSLDSRKSKAGDRVTARTLNPLKLADGMVIPRGTILFGRVTQAQPKSSGGATLAILFDQVAINGTDPMLVRGVIAAVARAPSLSDGGASNDDLPLGSGGDNKGRIAGMTGTSFGGDSPLLPPIQPGSAIKGVFLSPAAAADGSSVLSAPDKEIKLEKGTRLEIGLIAAQ